MCLNSNGELLLFDNVAVDVKNVTLMLSASTTERDDYCKDGNGGFVDFQNVRANTSPICYEFPNGRKNLSMSAETILKCFRKFGLLGVYTHLPERFDISPFA